MDHRLPTHQDLDLVSHFDLQLRDKESYVRFLSAGVEVFEKREKRFTHHSCFVGFGLAPEYFILSAQADRGREKREREPKKDLCFARGRLKFLIREKLDTTSSYQRFDSTSKSI